MDPSINVVTEVLDPILVPLGFAPGQIGIDRDQGQAIFCRGTVDGGDGGCVDLVLEIQRTANWRITDVRYWGLPSERWRLDVVREGTLADQLSGLAQSLPTQLG